MKFTNKRFKKGMLIISALSLIFALCICIPLANNFIFADTNCVNIYFDKYATDLGVNPQLYVTKVEVIYNGITYQGDTSSIEYRSMDGSNDRFSRYEDLSNPFPIESPYASNILISILDDKSFKGGDTLKDEGGNIIPPNLLDTISNVNVILSDNAKTVCDSYHMNYVEGKNFGIFSAIGADFILYKSTNPSYVEFCDLTFNTSENTICQSYTSNSAITAPPAYKTKLAGQVITKYSLTSEFFDNSLSVDFPFEVTTYPRTVYAISDTFRLNYDSTQNKVVTNISPYSKYDDGASSYSNIPISYQWKKIDMTKGYNLLNCFDFHGDTVIGYTLNGQVIELKVNEEDANYEELLGENKEYIDLILNDKNSNVFTEGDIVCIETDRPVSEIFADNYFLPSFYYKNDPIPGYQAMPDVSISEDRKTIFYRVSADDATNDKIELDFSSGTTYKILNVTYYPQSALSDVQNATISLLPSSLDEGLYVCEAKLHGLVNAEGGDYKVYSSPVNVGNKITFVTNINQRELYENLKIIDIIGKNYEPIEMITKESSLELPQCPWIVTDDCVVFTGWATYNSDGTYKRIQGDTLNNITSDTIVYTMFEKQKIIEYPTKNNNFKLKTNVSLLWGVFSSEDLDIANMCLSEIPDKNYITNMTLPYYSSESVDENFVFDLEPEVIYDIKAYLYDSELDASVVNEGDKFKFTFLDNFDKLKHLVIYEKTRDDVEHIIAITNDQDSLPDLYSGTPYEAIYDFSVFDNNSYTYTSLGGIDCIEYWFETTDDSNLPHIIESIDDYGDLGDYNLFKGNEIDMSSFEDGRYSLVNVLVDRIRLDGPQEAIKAIGTFTLDHNQTSGGNGSSHKKKTKETKTETKVEEPKEDNKVEIKMYIGKNEAIVNGTKKYLDTAPFIEDDRTFLPVRFISENLKANVSWDKVLRKVTVTNNDTTIILTIGSDIALVNDKEIKLDTKAFIKDDRTFIPIRFVSENLGCNVTFEKEQKEVSIKEKDNK